MVRHFHKFLIYRVKNLSNSVIRLNVNEVEKSMSLTKSSIHQNSVDYSGDAKLTSKTRPNNFRKYINTAVREIQTDETRETRMQRACSAPEVMRTEAQGSSTISQTDCSTDFRDASTNT